MKRCLTLLLAAVMLLSLVACGERKDTGAPAITQEAAYNLYYDTIRKFVPELMQSPQECDVDVTTRDEVTYLTEHFVRNHTSKIQAQNVDGKLQYFLLNQFPEAIKQSIYCIDGEKAYGMSSKLNGKGEWEEWSYSIINSSIFQLLNTPLFGQEAIKSFAAEVKDGTTTMTFVVDGANMEYPFSQRVMREIIPDIFDVLDDVTIVLTADEAGVPKTMSTELSMSIWNDQSGDLHAKKTLNMDFVFNKLGDVDFDLEQLMDNYVDKNDEGQTEIPTEFASVFENKQVLKCEEKTRLLSELLSDHGYTIGSCAVVDMDGDTQPEVAVMMGVPTNDILILKKDETSYYGHLFTFRGMYLLNTDGSFYWNNSAGNYGCSRLTFKGDQREEIELWHVERDGNDSHTYYVDGREVSEAEFESATAEKKEEVQWVAWD